MSNDLPGGVVHELTGELRDALLADDSLAEAWRSLTPLARNEWLCWIQSGKQEATRKRHFERALVELSEGVRRPCCWIGCIHRADKEISPSVQYILNRSKKSK